MTSDNRQPESEPTPVDDVRRIRERFSREAGGNMERLAELDMRTFEEYREKLGLKLVSPPKGGRRRTGTQG